MKSDKITTPGQHSNGQYNNKNDDKKDKTDSSDKAAVDGGTKEMNDNKVTSTDRIQGEHKSM